MFKLLRLIRFPNLLVVALTQWLVAVPLIGTALQKEGLASSLTYSELALLILATCSVTAAGYVINDLLDYEIDLVNRPDKVIVSKHIQVGTVNWLVGLFTIFGFIASLTLSLVKQETEWLWLYPLVIGLLGWYPNIFKRNPFLGNLLVAFCCAGVAGLVWLAERNSWRQLTESAKEEVSYLLILFMLYAFLSTWIREIIKDVEDMKGDASLGRRTFPIVSGITTTKKIIYLLSALLASILIYNCLVASIPVLFLSITLLISLLFITWHLIKASNSTDFHQLSRYWKFYLLGGLALLFVYQY